MSAIARTKRSSHPHFQISSHPVKPNMLRMVLLLLSAQASSSGFTSTLSKCSIYGHEASRVAAVKVLSRPEELKFDADNEELAEELAERVRLPARQANLENFCYYERQGSELDDCRDLAIAARYVSMLADETIKESYERDIDPDPTYRNLYTAYQEELEDLKENQNNYLRQCMANLDFCDNERDEEESKEVDKARLRFLAEAANHKRHFKSHLQSLQRIEEVYSRRKCKERIRARKFR